LKHAFRIAIVLAFSCAVLAAFSNVAQAQRIDIGFGVSTTLAPSANAFEPSLKGGTFPGFSGDVLFWHNLGIGSEVYFRASQSGNYQGAEGFTYRPVFYNFNAVYSPKLAHHTYLELVGGIGAIDTHVYECGVGISSNGGCIGGSSLYTSSNHFDVDLGAGVKFYLKGGLFLRPEGRYYWINNNTSDYSSNHAGRVGATIGYTFR
jgi:hypothetical protein